MRVVEHGREQRDGRLGFLVRSQKLCQRLAAQERRVGVEDDHRAGPAMLRAYLREGVARTQLLALRHGLSLAIECGLDPVLVRVGDHQGALRVEGTRRRHRPEQHGPPGDRMEHLGNSGVHPDSLAGGEHHHRDAPARLRQTGPLRPRGCVGAHGRNWSDYIGRGRPRSPRLSPPGWSCNVADQR